MAEYNWEVKLDKKHKVTVDHPFSGDIVVKLDGKEVHRESSHELDHTFEIDGKPCNLVVKEETQSFGGMATMKTWVHNLYVNGEKQPLA
jgi:hypothetical protein